MGDSLIVGRVRISVNESEIKSVAIGYPKSSWMRVAQTAGTISTLEPFSLTTCPALKK